MLLIGSDAPTLTRLSQGGGARAAASEQKITAFWLEARLQSDPPPPPPPPPSAHPGMHGHISMDGSVYLFIIYLFIYFIIYFIIT